MRTTAVLFALAVSVMPLHAQEKSSYATIESNRLYVRVMNDRVSNANVTLSRGDECFIPLGEKETKIFHVRSTPDLYKYIRAGTPPGNVCPGGTAFLMDEETKREVAAYMPIL